MGVYPEPALCADDVSRLAPRGSRCSGSIARPFRQASSSTKHYRAAAASGRARNVLAAAVIGLAVAASAPAAAYEGARVAALDTQALSDRRADTATPEWGGERLLDGEPATLAVAESLQASPARPKSASGEEFLAFGNRRVPRSLVDTIVRAAEATGVDPVYMMALADKESSFDTDVRNPASSAQGLFQFITGTWFEMIRDHGAKHGLVEEAAAVSRRGRPAGIADPDMRRRVLALRNDPYVAGLMAGELIKRDREKIENRIGRELKTTELYLAHFLGTASAGKFLTLSAEDPGKVASSEFRSAARANRSLFTESGAGKSRPLTVAELHERLDEMIDRRISQFEEITTLVAQPAQAEPAAAEPVLDARLRVPDAAIPTVR